MNTIKRNRRRFIGIMAAAAPHADTLTSWHGIALGADADAELHIHHPDGRFAQQLIRRAITEVRRLERVSSLYDSAIALEGRSVQLSRPGMALTLNGIAQGYITDRVTELLRDAGLEHALVDMSEIRGLAARLDLQAWVLRDGEDGLTAIA